MQQYSDKGEATSVQGEVLNRVLRMLPVAERLEILSAAECVRIRRRQVLHQHQLPMEHVYFVDQGLVSVAAKVGSEKFVEVWLIGSEGVVGAPLVLAQSAVSSQRRTVQIGGYAHRIAVRDFRELVAGLPALRAVLSRYLAVVLAQISQTGACNAAHPLRQRLARWLLMARHATVADAIPLTHEALGQLLGVRRASVTECLDSLAQDDLLSTSRGTITISDAGELEKYSCECFQRICAEYRRQMG